MAKENVRICVVGGGHLTPALATIEKLLDKKASILFVGREVTDIYNSASKEMLEAEKLGVGFETISPAKFHRKPLSRNVSEPKKALISIAQAFKIIRRFNPDVVLCFGGYVALPIALIARLKSIPIITHEQTSVLGKSNQVISKFATRLAISWESSVAQSNKVILTGNPIRTQITNKQATPEWFQKQKLPLIYITGGNQGARDINRYIVNNLEKLTKKYQLIHQTGDARDREDYNLALQAKKSLPKTLRKNYSPKTWLADKEVAWLMQSADLVVGRSGANTIAELLVNETNSLLIPLPFSAKGEQYANAQKAVQMGFGAILEEKDLDCLSEEIEKRIFHKVSLSEYGKKMKELHLKAASMLAGIVLACVEE